MSSSYSSHYTGALPMAVPTKVQYADYGYATESTYSVSPPEGDISVGPSSGGGSFSNSGFSTTASYAGSSQGDFDSAAGIDFNEFMNSQFADTFDPLRMDKAIATQSKTSGHLNAKHRELREKQAAAKARLAKSRARFAEGMEDAKEVRETLEWTQKKLASMTVKASKKHSKEHQKARARHPSPEY